jgi:hypothetical protein
VPFITGAPLIKENLMKLLTDTSLTRDQRKKLFGVCVSEILTNQEIRLDFQRSEIEEKVEEILQRIAGRPEEEREGKLTEELEKLDRYFAEQIAEWLILVPVDNLTLGVRSVRIGNVRLFCFDERARKRVRNLYWSVIKPNPNYSLDRKEDYVKWEDENVLKRLEGKVCGEFCSRGRLDKVHERAIEEVLNSLRIIKFYSFADYEFTGRTFGITGDMISQSVIRIFVRYALDHPFADPLMERVGPLFPFELGRKKIAVMRRHGLKNLDRILRNTTRTELEQALITSINWFGEALDTMAATERTRSKNKTEPPRVQLRLGDCLLKLVMAMESLLVSGGEEPISNTLAERTAFLLAREYENRCKLKTFVRDMYDLRSKVVHGGQKLESKDDIKSLTYIVFMSILTLIKNSDKMGIKTRSDLRNWFEKEKLT